MTTKLLPLYGNLSRVAGRRLVVFIFRNRDGKHSMFDFRFHPLQTHATRQPKSPQKLVLVALHTMPSCRIIHLILSSLAKDLEHVSILQRNFHVVFHQTCGQFISKKHGTVRLTFLLSKKCWGVSSLSSNWTIKSILASISWRLSHSNTLRNQLV